MKLNILDGQNVQKGSIELPSQFSETIRPDLVKRAVETIQANKRQPYGADPEAGKRYSAEISRRRRKYRGSYGMGISRVPRKIVSRRGTRLNMVGALAPGTVGGRRAHPPKVDKDWDRKLNKKERRKAVRSALAATMVKDVVSQRGHLMPDKFPFIIDNSFENMAKTKIVSDALAKMGFSDELSRASVKNVRAGKGTMRGRKYQRRKGPLFIVSKNCPLSKTARNIPGVDVVVVDKVNTELLAPGAAVGRLTLYTEEAIKRLTNEKLFTDSPVVKKVDRKALKKAVKEEKKTKEIEKKKKKALKRPAPKKEKGVKKAPVKKPSATKTEKEVPKAVKKEAPKEVKPSAAKKESKSLEKRAEKPKEKVEANPQKEKPAEKLPTKEEKPKQEKKVAE